MDALRVPLGHGSITVDPAERCPKAGGALRIRSPLVTGVSSEGVYT